MAAGAGRRMGGAGEKRPRPCRRVMTRERGRVAAAGKRREQAREALLAFADHAVVGAHPRQELLRQQAEGRAAEHAGAPLQRPRMVATVSQTKGR